MATQLSIVNQIMQKLREDEVTSVADNPYSKLIASFVNDAKADMEDINYEWSVYITAVDDTILADGTRVYDITETNDRSYLMRKKDDRYPMAFDVTAGEEAALCDIPYKDLLDVRNRTTGSSTSYTDRPYTFSVVSDADGRGWSIELLWGSSVERTWRTHWYIPQEDLALDGSDDSTSLLLPSRPIYLQALYYALNERGEEMGEPGGIAASRAKNAIAAALELDMQVQKKSDELDINNNENL